MTTLNKGPIVALGEFVLDVYPDHFVPGGAPANFVYHCSRLGFKATLISAVGNDDNALVLIDACKQNNINAYLQRNSFPSGKVNVTLPQNSIPNYEIVENSSWDNYSLDEKSESLLTSASLLAIGTLFSRTNHVYREVLKAMDTIADNALIYLDVNFRQNYYNKQILAVFLNRIDILKCTRDEYLIICKMFNIKADLNENGIRIFSKQFAISTVLITDGENGSMVYDEGIFSHMRALQVDVIDTVGAGDAFGAAYLTSKMVGKNVEKCHSAANVYAAEVCRISGAWFLDN